jgi:hypothetical protein
MKKDDATKLATEEMQALLASYKGPIQKIRQAKERGAARPKNPACPVVCKVAGQKLSTVSVGATNEPQQTRRYEARQTSR